MVNQGKNIAIALFVLVALSILIFILLYLRPSVGDNKQKIHVRFANIDKVSIGTRITLGGRPIGEVLEIREIGNARQEQAPLPGGPIYIYELTLGVDSKTKVYTSDLFSISTSGLLGERSIEITPSPAFPGKPFRLLTPKDLFFAEPPTSIEETVKEFNNLAKKGEVALDFVNEQLGEIKQRKLWENLATTAQNLSDITTAFNRPNDIADIVTNIYDFFVKAKEVGEKVSKSWDSADEALHRFATASQNIEKASEDVAATTAKIKKGEGTIGKLIYSNEFYLQISALLGKARTLMDDINHYGLLFHNNKAWQRLRARRINLMAKLSTPQEFRNFFDDEVDQISTSLSRVSMVLTETEQEYGPELLANDPEFSLFFADLLRRVKTLEENINLYNQQLNDQ